MGCSPLHFKVPLEEQLDAEQLESLKKYQERKQQKQTHVYSYGQVRQVDSGHHQSQKLWNPLGELLILF